MEHTDLLTAYPAYSRLDDRSFAALGARVESRTRYLPWLKVSVFFCLLDALVVLVAGLLLFASSSASAAIGPASYAVLAAAPVLTVGILNGHGLYGRFAMLLPVEVLRVASIWLQAFGLIFLTATTFAAVHALGAGGPATPVWPSAPWMAFLLVGFAGLSLPRLIWSSVWRR